MSIQTVSYTISSSKIHTGCKIAFFSDLHDRVWGEANQELLAAFWQERPDLILCTGDLSIAKQMRVSESALLLLERLKEIAPVYFVNGNHESELRQFPEVYEYAAKRMKEIGIHCLNNAHEKVTVGGEELLLYGLELPLVKYKKLRRPHLTVKEIKERIGKADQTHFSILLSHNPQFVSQYFDWGADLSLSGHFHGGVMRLWKGQVLLSPYGFFLPKYGYGDYTNADQTQHAIVTAGLGDHVIPFRIHNPEEIVVISLRKKEKD